MSWNRPLPSTSASAKRSRQGTLWRRAGATVFALWLSCGGTAAAQIQLLDRVLAIVNGDVIMESDLGAFLELDLIDVPTLPETEAEVLTYLIERRLMLNEVDRFWVGAPDLSAVEQRYKEIGERFSSAAEFDRVLDRHGFSPDDLRQIIADEARRKAYATNRFSAVDAELREQARSEWVARLVSQAQIQRTP